MSTSPNVKKKKSTIIIAILAPIVAIIISYGMLQEYINQKGNEIVIYINDIKGLDVSKSHLEFQGLKIGKLKSISIDENNLKRFKVTVQIYKEFNYFIKEGTKFWIVSPQVNLNRIENIGTVLTGNYIEVLPPTLDIGKLENLEYKYKFTALESRPKNKGKIVNLVSSNGKISNNSTIEYKGIKIGEILNKKILKSNKINYTILIYEKYINLINSKTLFYKVDPLDIKLSASELSINVPSISNILYSSINFINDDSIIDKNRSILYDSKSQIYLNNRVIKLKVKGHNNFDYIYYKNTKVATVMDNKFNLKTNINTIYVKFNFKYFYLLKTDPKFFIKKNNIDFSNLNLKKIIDNDKLIIVNNFNKKTKIKDIYTVNKFDENINIKGIILELTDIKNINKNEKILYKNIEIGFVKDIYLKNGTKKAKILIYNKYKNLINNSTIFYQIEDFNLDISLEGVEFSVGSFQQLYKGGISFITHNKGLKFTKKVFPIYKNIKLAKDIINKPNFFNITLNLKDAYNLKTTSNLYYKNVKIGTVRDIKLDDNVKVSVKIDNKYKYLFTKKSTIYMEGTKISIENVQNLSSSILGDKLHLISIKDKSFKDTFIVNDINPIDTKYKNGLRIVLEHTNAKDISVSTPIFYNDYPIGKVESLSLNTKTDMIQAHIFIDPKYTKYIKEDTIFTKTIIIDMDLGLFSSTVKIGTVDNFMHGGIDIINKDSNASQASFNKVFKLTIKE